MGFFTFRRAARRGLLRPDGMDELANELTHTRLVIGGTRAPVSRHAADVYRSRDEIDQMVREVDEVSRRSSMREVRSLADNGLVHDPGAGVILPRAVLKTDTAAPRRLAGQYSPSRIGMTRARTDTAGRINFSLPPFHQAIVRQRCARRRTDRDLGATCCTQPWDECPMRLGTVSTPAGTSRQHMRYDSSGFRRSSADAPQGTWNRAGKPKLR